MLKPVATAGHAASSGASGALSFATGDLIASYAGWEAAFIVASASATIALVIVSLVVPSRSMPVGSSSGSTSLYDFRRFSRIDLLWLIQLHMPFIPLK